MNGQVPLIGVYGKSGSGKTSLIERLIEALRGENYSLCTLKHVQGDRSIDEEGKDTWRHGQAGARMIVFASARETAFILKESMNLERIVQEVEGKDLCDVLLVEGFKGGDLPKVAVGNISPREGTIHVHREDFEETKRAVLEEIRIQKLANKLGGMNCGRCGFPSCRDLAREIAAGRQDLQDCPVEREGTGVKLKVDGERVPLSTFPARLIKNIVEGAVRSLKGVEGELKKVELEIREEEKKG